MMDLLKEIIARLRLNPGCAKPAVILGLIGSAVDLAASLASITLMGPLATVAGDMGVVGLAVVGFGLALVLGGLIDWCKWPLLEGLSAPAEAWHRQVLTRARPDNAAAIVAELDQQDASFGPVTLATLSEIPGGLALLVVLGIISWQIALAAVVGIGVMWGINSWQADTARAETEAWKAARQRAAADPDSYFAARRRRARTIATRRLAGQQGTLTLYVLTLALGAVLVAQHLLDPAAMFAIGLLVNRLSGLTQRLHGVRGELIAGYESLGRLAKLLAEPATSPVAAAPQQRVVLVSAAKPQPQPQPQIQGAQ